MHIVLGVTESDASANAFNFVKLNPYHLWTDLHLSLVHVITKDTTSGVTLLRKYEEQARNFAKSVTTKLLPRQKGVGQTLKEFVASRKEAQILVLGCTREKWKVIDYCTQRCSCPVIVVKNDYFTPTRPRPILAHAMDVNVHCDRTFSWFLQHGDLPMDSQLYVVHITPKKSDKPDARRFLASLKPKCMESKRKYSMASALVSYDRGSVSDGIIRFCHDKDVQMLMLSSKGDGQSLFRLSNSITEICLRYGSMDIMVWMDEQTRNICSSRYILNLDKSPPPVPLATWDNPAKVSLGKNFLEEDIMDKPESKDESWIETKAKKIPPQPTYPRPRASTYPLPKDSTSPLPKDSTSPFPKDTGKQIDTDAPIAPIGGGYTQPVAASIGERPRRKNSLKYYMYDQIARGKKSLSRQNEDSDSRWNGIYLEPLSP